MSVWLWFWIGAAFLGWTACAVFAARLAGVNQRLIEAHRIVTVLHETRRNHRRTIGEFESRVRTQSAVIDALTACEAGVQGDCYLAAGITLKGDVTAIHGKEIHITGPMLEVLGRLLGGGGVGLNPWHTVPAVINGRNVVAQPWPASWVAAQKKEHGLSDEEWSRAFMADLRTFSSVPGNWQ